MGFKQGSNMISFVLQKDHPVYYVNKKMGVTERWGVGLEAQGNSCSPSLHKDP